MNSNIKNYTKREEYFYQYIKSSDFNDLYFYDTMLEVCFFRNNQSITTFNLHFVYDKIEYDVNILNIVEMTENIIYTITPILTTKSNIISNILDKNELEYMQSSSFSHKQMICGNIFNPSLNLRDNEETLTHIMDSPNLTNHHYIQKSKILSFTDDKIYNLIKLFLNYEFTYHVSNNTAKLLYFNIGKIGIKPIRLELFNNGKVKDLSNSFYKNRNPIYE